MNGKKQKKDGDKRIFQKQKDDIIQRKRAGEKLTNTRLKLVENKKQKKRNKIILLLCLLLILGIGTYFFIADFSIKNIEVTGNHTYTDTEIIQAMQSQDYVGNTLLMLAQNQIFGQTYLPFIEKISMSYEDTHTLKVKVKEKLRAGTFSYMEKQVYFNEQGIAMESRNRLFDGVPVVSGVTYDTLVLGERIPVKGDYFNIIVSITKKIATYGLSVSEIHFDTEDEITLLSGKFTIYLGSSAYLEGKMERISSALDAVSKKYEEGNIDMHLYTDDKNIITYHK